MERQLIGSHNSATGERPLGLFSLLAAPVARCQDRTIKEQLMAGVGLLDLRVKPYRRGPRGVVPWPKAKLSRCHLGHGLADYDITLGQALRMASAAARAQGRGVYAIVTLEGRLRPHQEALFVSKVQAAVKTCPGVILLEAAVKYPKWRQLWRSASPWGYACDYALIKGRRALLPFPRLWARFVKPSGPEDRTFSLRDFV